MLNIIISILLCLAAAAQGGWRIRLDTLPNFVYAGETRLLAASAIHDQPTNACLQIQILPEGRTVPLYVAPPTPADSNLQAAASTGAAVVSFHVDAGAPLSSAPVTIRVVTRAGEALATCRYLLVGHAVSNVPIHRRGSHYCDNAGSRVVWVNTLRTWREKRKWLLPRRAARAFHRRHRPVLWLGNAADWTTLEEPTPAYNPSSAGLHGEVALESILDLPLLLRNPPFVGGGAPNLIVSLPPADIDGRLAREDLVRAVDLSARWVRECHGDSVSIVLLTPFPRPGQCGVTETAAAAIREAGRHAELPVVDLHAGMLGIGAWESLYTADGVVYHDMPLPAGQDLAAQLLAKMFPKLRSRSPGQPVAASLPCAASALPPASTSRQWHTVDAGPSLLDCAFPGEAGHWGLPPVADTEGGAIGLGVTLPRNAPADVAATLRMKDKDGLWFQLASGVPLIPGETNRLIFPVGRDAVGIDGGPLCWDDFYRRRMRETGLGLFSGSTWTGRATIVDVAVRTETPPARPPRILGFRAPPPETVCTGRYELAFILDNTSGLNPFDPREIEVKATFESPSGKRSRVDGFFYQSFTRMLEGDKERLAPIGRPEWRVRFTPTEAGRYSFTLHVQTPRGTAVGAPRRFIAQPSSRLGFVRASAADPRLFECADGTPFYPIGLNIHAPFDVRAAEMERRRVSPNHGTFAYDRYFERLAAAGANTCVVWLAPWWLEIEWSREWRGFGGLGDFNLENAWRLDTLLGAAERHGIRLHLVLENHGKYSLWMDTQWDSNPYNRANGGMLERPEEFFASSAAAAAYRRKLRYLVARYASSPSVLGWELFGEMNLVGSSPRFANHPSHARWIAATARFIHESDPYRHLLAVHYSNDWRTVDPAVAALPELDYLVGDIYKPGGSIVDWVVETARRNGAYGKPTFSTEFGGYWNGSTPARLEADLHAGLWSNFMTPAAGAPFFWWFEFVDRNNLYAHLRALASFAGGENRCGILPTEEPPVAYAGSRNVRALLLRRRALPHETAGTRAWLWVFDSAAMEVLPEERHAPVISGATLRLALPPGAYGVEYWDTYSGRITDVAESVAPPGKPLELPLPPFRRDLAVKILDRRQTTTWRMAETEGQE